MRRERMLAHSTLRQRDSAITVAEKVISRRTVGDHLRPAKTEEHPKAEVEANEDPNEDINEAVPEDAVVAEEQLSRGKKTPANPVKTQQRPG
jgi:hypothetical protein